MSAFGVKADIAAGGVLAVCRNGRPDVTRITYKFFHFRYQWVLEARRGHKRALLILVVDDEPDVEVLFRQQFRHDSALVVSR
jgi:hypothetical protein